MRENKWLFKKCLKLEIKKNQWIFVGKLFRSLRDVTEDFINHARGMREEKAQEEAERGKSFGGKCDRIN